MDVDVITVVGARPQFVKTAAVSRAFLAYNESQGDVRFRERIAHTGQHYDDNMSKIFFDDLRIPRPHVNLGVGSGAQGAQTAAMLERIERVLLDERPDWVLIYGDTNSTLAGALAAVKLHIPIAHVESGLRSYNLRIPEEVNRVLAGNVSDLLLCPTEYAVRCLAKEGVTRGVHQVGDVMYDSVLFNLALAEQSSRALEDLDVEPGGFYLSTIHRAENTNDKSRLLRILAALESLGRPVLLPLHPRTRDTLGADLTRVGRSVRVLEPVPYLDMLMLEKHARIILTDSGGVQREAYWMGVPCVTLRDETEWVELVEAGCNRVVGADPDAIRTAVADWEAADAKLPADRPQDLYGDGHAADKIAAILAKEAIARA